MTEYINHTEEKLLNIITELQHELETCQDPEIRLEIQGILDENFLTLGIFYKTYLYGEGKRKMTEEEEKLINKVISRAQRDTEFTMLSKYQGAFYLLLSLFKDYHNNGSLVFDKIEHELHLLQLKMDTDYIEKWGKVNLEDNSTFPLGLINREHPKHD